MRSPRTSTAGPSVSVVMARHGSAAVGRRGSVARPKSAVTDVTSGREFQRQHDPGLTLVPELGPAPASSRNRAPPATGSSSQRAVSTRRMWPWANSATSPSAAAQRAPAPGRPRLHHLRGASPPGQPSRHRSQSGRAARICGRGQPLVLAVVPLPQLVARSRRARRSRPAGRSPAPAAAGWRARARTRTPPAAAASRPRSRAALLESAADRSARVLSGQAPLGLPRGGRRRSPGHGSRSAALSPAMPPVRSISATFASRRTWRASPLNSRREERGDDLGRDLGSDHPPAEAEDVDVVVLDALVGGVVVVDRRRPDPRGSCTPRPKPRRPNRTR